MAPLWPFTFSSGERPRALWALLFTRIIFLLRSVCICVLLQVISRIMYCINRSWTGRLTIQELRRSNLFRVSIFDNVHDLGGWNHGGLGDKLSANNVLSLWMNFPYFLCDRNVTWNSIINMQCGWLRHNFCSQWKGHFRVVRPWTLCKAVLK